MPLPRFVPPFRGLSDRRIADLAGSAFMPVDVARDKQYLLSVKHGRVLEPRTLKVLLRGGYHWGDEEPGGSGPEPQGRA